MEIVVDVKSAIKTSKSKFLRNLPGFVVNIIKRIICEDELNRIHNKYRHLQGIDYVKALLFDEYRININIYGEENIEKEKKYVYIANHPMGSNDALSFLYLVDKIHGNVISPSNQLFEYVPNLRPVIIGINVFKQNSKEQVKLLNDAFESEKQIMIFPAGEVSRKIKGEIIDPEWQKTFVTKAVQFKRDIVPVFITGQNSKKFYRVAKFRKSIGLKTYLETTLLPSEMLKQKNMKLDMYIGNPISYVDILNSEKSHQQWTEDIRKIVYSQNPQKNRI